MAAASAVSDSICLRANRCLLWNLLDLKRVRWEGPDALAPEAHAGVRLQIRRPRLCHAGVQQHQRPRPRRHRHVHGGRQGGATEKLDHTVPLTLPWDETFDIGSDTGTPVDDQDYQVPFAFTGKINKLTFAIERPKLTPQDVEKLKKAEMKNSASQ